MQPDAVARLLSAIASLPGPRRPRLVCIDGPSGGGKSSLAAALAHALPGTGVVHTDHLLAGWGGLSTLESALLEQVVLPSRDGRRIQHRRYDWDAGRFGTPLQVEAEQLLLLEGVGAGSRAVAAHADLVVWVDADPHTRRDRALARDPEVTGWWETWARAETSLHHAERTRERAGLVVLT